MMSVIVCCAELCQEFRAFQEEVDFSFKLNLVILKSNFVNLFEILIYEVHLILVKNDVDKPKQLNFLICVNKLLIKVVDVPLELSVEIAFNNSFMVCLESRCRHNDRHNLSFGFVVIFQFILVSFVQTLQEFFRKHFGLIKVEVQVEQDTNQRDFRVYNNFVSV